MSLIYNHVYVYGTTLDNTTGACTQLVKFTLSGHLFTNLGVPECPCCLELNIYFVMYMDY